MTTCPPPPVPPPPALPSSSPGSSPPPAGARASCSSSGASRASSPGQVALARLLFGALFLGGWLLVTRTALPRDRVVWGHFVVLGVLFCFAPFTLFAYAETLVDSGLAAILNATTPLWTLVMVLLFLPTERVTTRKAVGLLVGFAGVVVVALPQVTGLGGRDALLGQAACLSVNARAAGRMVLVRSHADRIVVLLGDEVVADHPRQFRRDQIIYDPWHYLPVLMKKPGALRNGAPFKDWALPPALTQVRAKLKQHADGDRQFVKVLGAVLDHGLAAVEAACAEALEAGIASGDVILTVLARRRQPAAPPSITTPDALRLKIEPTADCGRYDSIRKVA